MHVGFRIGGQRELCLNDVRFLISLNADSPDGFEMFVTPSLEYVTVQWLHLGQFLLGGCCAAMIMRIAIKRAGPDQPIVSRARFCVGVLTILVVLRGCLIWAMESSYLDGMTDIGGEYLLSLLGWVMQCFVWLGICLVLDIAIRIVSRKNIAGE